MHVKLVEEGAVGAFLGFVDFGGGTAGIVDEASDAHLGKYAGVILAEERKVI
jgi:hypothetical protein